MGWIECVRWEKFWRDFVARTFAPVRPVLHRVSKVNQMVPNAPKLYENAPKHEFRVQWGGTGAFVAKNSDAASWHELLHQFGPFCTEFRKSTKRSQMHQNCTKHTKTWVQGPMGVDWLPWLRKIPRRLHGTNFCTSSAHFAPSFVSQPNGPKCTKLYERTKTWI